MGKPADPTRLSVDGVARRIGALKSEPQSHTLPWYRERHFSFPPKYQTHALSLWVGSFLLDTRLVDG